MLLEPHRPCCCSRLSRVSDQQRRPDRLPLHLSTQSVHPQRRVESNGGGIAEEVFFLLMQKLFDVEKVYMHYTAAMIPYEDKICGMLETFNQMN